jgi:hypothetical protein
MRRWFSKIESREQALSVIRNCAAVFFVLAVLQVLAGLALLALQSDPSFTVSTDFIANLFVTAAIIGIVASILRGANSRIAATLLLVLSLAIAASTAVRSAGSAHGNLFGAIIAIGASIRAMQATFKLHGKFAKQEQPAPSPQSPPKPAADFVSHPKAGVESTAATAAASQSPKPYDREKWAALLKYDDDIAIVAGRISHLGQRWVDELAHAYLALNDKGYLDKIEKKIYADARAEAARSRL